VIIKSYEQFLKLYWPDRWREYVIATYPSGKAGRIFAREIIKEKIIGELEKC